MKTSSPLKLTASALAFCLGAGGSTLAMAAFPERPVTVIVPFAPGAAADAAMRVVGKKLGEIWGQTVLVDNRPGAQGMVGATNARPDGYTLVLAAGSGIVTAPLTNPKLAYKPSDLAPIGRVTTSQSALVVNTALGVNNVAELLAKAKAKPGSLSYASSGQGAPNHLGMELFLMTTGTDMVHIPYRGAAPAMVDLLSNQVQLSINAVPTVLPYARQGKLKVLAIGSDKRSSMLPDVPTLEEAGVKGVEVGIWYALFAPAKTPQPIIQKLAADLDKALRDPEVAQQIAQQGAEASPLSPEDLQRFIVEDTKRWARTIRERNLKLED